MALASRLLPLGDSAVTVQFGTEVSAEANARVLGFSRALAQAVQRGELTGVVEWVPTFASVTVHVDDDASEADAAARDAALLALAESAEPMQAAGRRWRLPACFEPEFAPDLQALADTRGLSVAQVVALVSGTPFRVYMLGFLPGFPYMGDLPVECEVPRLATPRRVPERSIAVAGRMCAVYPWQSPGGWHLIGRTPVRLFDGTNDDDPALLRAGDEVQWQAVDAATYQALDRRAAAGKLQRGELLLQAGEA
jgi:inhibitor of KinA